MNWRGYQRFFEISAVLLMMAGVLVMWMRKDPQHLLVYGGFVLLATGKLIEAVNVDDPKFKVFKIVMCASLYVLVMLNLFYNIRSIVYILIPLGIYYGLHYRLRFQQKKT